jgi:putative ABC transport system ATP-binding protein
MISVRNLQKTYQRGQTEVRAIRGIDLDIIAGGLTVIMGPSGSGKSTLLHLIGCLDTPTSGDIQLDGTNLSHLSSNERAELRARSIGFVFQSFNQIPNLTAVENVELPMLLGHVSRKEARRKAEVALKRVGLEKRINHRPAELSGGELQRVAIARALVNSPSIVLADEPTGNLDTETGEQVISMLMHFKDNGKTLIIVSHNPDIGAVADFLVQMRDGVRVEPMEQITQEVLV